MITYNVPAHLATSYSDQQLIIRSSDPEDLLKALSLLSPERVHYVQMCSLESGASAFGRADTQLWVDLVIQDIKKEVPLLYNFKEYSPPHSMRVTIPCSPGVGEAVNVAVALGFPVKLDFHQPPCSVFPELHAVLDDQLHKGTVNCPVEFFYSLLSSYINRNETTIWDIQEENPDRYRYVTDAGVGCVSSRSPILQAPAKKHSFIQDVREELLQESGECASCDFFDHCIGYFKFPDRQYSCNETKRLLAILKQASVDLLSDLSGQKTGMVQQIDTGDCNQETAHYTPYTDAVVYCSFECPNDCIFCAVSEMKGRNTPSLSKTVYDFIEDCAQKGISELSFSGAGEPTINSDLPAYVNFASQVGIKYLSITTNGFGITDDLLRRLMDAGLLSYCVSLHGVGEIHDRIVRRRGSYEEAIRAIDLINQNDPELLTVNTCLNRFNIEQCDHIMEIVMNFQAVSYHHISQPEWNGNAYLRRHEMCRISEIDERLNGIKRRDYPLVHLVNIPLCIAPHLPHQARSNTIVFLNSDGEGHLVQRSDNLGNNCVPLCCQDECCLSKNNCPGLDVRYLEEYGTTEIRGKGRDAGISETT